MSLSGPPPALELADIGVRLDGRLVLEGVGLRAGAGEVLGVLGANGSGKTTLLRAALGLLPLAAGEARLGGRTVSTLSAPVRAALAGYLPQERPVGWNMTAWRIAALGAPLAAPAEARRRAFAALDEVGALALAERGVREMSGGERGRVLLARLFVTAAPLLVADEPAAGLDPDAQLRVMELLRQRAVAGAAIVASLHDLTLAARFCDRVAILARGRLIALGPTREVLDPAVLEAAFDLQGEVLETPAGAVVAARRRPQRPSPTTGAGAGSAGA